MQQITRKLMMTLVLLMTAAAGAWATIYTGPVAISSLQVGDILLPGFSLTGDGYIKLQGKRFNWNGSPLSSDLSVQNGYITYNTDGTLTISNVSVTPVDGDGNDGNAWEVTATSPFTLAGTTYDPNAVNPTANANEWSMAMPAGNVLLTVAYKDRATMALTYGGTPITAEANAVTAFKGCEQEFAEALTPAVQNIEPTFNSGTAQDVATTLAADFTFKSSDANIIGFKSGETYAAEGTLDQMEFRALTTSPVTLTVTYKGTDDLESKSQALLVTIEKKTYTVSLDDGGKDTQNWKGNVNDAETDVNLPITKLEGGEKVTLKYNGRLKVKSVTATTDAKPAAGKTVDLSTYSGTSYEVTEDVTFTGTTNNEISILYKGDDYEVTLDNVNAPKCFIAAQDDSYNINVKLKGTSRLMGIYTQNAYIIIGEAAAGGTVILVDESPLGGNGTEVTINGGTVKAKATASSTVYSMLEVNGGAVYLEAAEDSKAVSISASGSVTLYGWNGSAWETYSEHRYLSTDNSKAPSQWTW